MGQAIGALLPSAAAVALSPIPIVAVILMLSTPRAKTNGPAFAVAWMIGLAAVSSVVRPSEHSRKRSDVETGSSQ